MQALHPAWCKLQRPSPEKAGTSRCRDLWTLWGAHAFSNPTQEESRVIDRKIRRKIKRRLETERPTVWIGKSGASAEITAEIDRQLKEKEVLKLKIQKAALKNNDAKAIAMELASRTQSTLIEIRGHTFILYRSKE
jgi:RNA-binding protein